MFKLFRGVRNILSNVSQIILVVFLLPIVALIIRFIAGSEGGSSMGGMFIELLGNIPLFEAWVGILAQFGEGLSAGIVLESIPLVILKALPETIIVAVAVHFCNEVGTKIGTLGLPILSTFIGVAVSTIALVTIGKSSSELMSLIIEFGVLIVMAIGFKIMFSSLFRGASLFSFKKIFEFLVDGVFAVIVTAYVTAMLMLMSGSIYFSTGVAIAIIFTLSAVVVGVGFAVWIFGGRKRLFPEL